MGQAEILTEKGSSVPGGATWFKFGSYKLTEQILLPMKARIIILINRSNCFSNTLA